MRKIGGHCFSESGTSSGCKRCGKGDEASRWGERKKARKGSHFRLLSASRSPGAR